MKKEVFAKRLVNLRKKKGYTQAELAEKLNVSNKTVSRWETAEGYPDISLLKPLSELLGVTCDELLSDELDYTQVTKYDIQSYLPFLISLVGVLVYYILIKLQVSNFLSFGIFVGVLIFSFYFVIKHTDKKNLKKVTCWNMLMLYFPLVNFISNILLYCFFFGFLSDFSYDFTMGYDASMNFMFGMENMLSLLDPGSLMELLILPYILGLVVIVIFVCILLYRFKNLYQISVTSVIKNIKLLSNESEKKLVKYFALFAVITLACLFGFWLWRYIRVQDIASVVYGNEERYKLGDFEMTVSKNIIHVIIFTLCLVQTGIVMKSRYRKIYLPCILALFIYCILVSTHTGIEDLYFIQIPMLVSVVGAILLSIIYLLVIIVIKKKIKKTEEVEVQ